MWNKRGFVRITTNLHLNEWYREQSSVQWRSSSSIKLSYSIYRQTSCVDDVLTMETRFIVEAQL